MLSSVRYDLGARVLRNGAGLAKNVAYYVARRNFAETYPNVVGEFLSHVALAASWARDNAAAVADHSSRHPRRGSPVAPAHGRLRFAEAG